MRLPWVLAHGGTASELAATLRHRVEIHLYNSSLDRAADNPALSYSISLPKLNTQRLGVQYRPATPIDTQAWDDLQQSGATSIPLYAINVTPVLQLEGEVVATGDSATTLGQDHIWTATLQQPNSSAAYADMFLITTGDEFVFGINGNGVTQNMVQTRFNQYGSDTVAENLQQVALHYWMELDMIGHLFAQRTNVAVQRQPSVGIFAAPLSATLMYGIPMSGSYRTWLMDVARSKNAIAATDDSSRLQVATQIGMITSYLEGSVFDQLLSQFQGHAKSAAQILLDAASEDIPIYLLDQNNATATLPLITLGAQAKQDVQNALAAGKTVLLPERAPDNAMGYVITDPLTGSGAYLIEHGKRGGAGDKCNNEVQPQAVKVNMNILAATAVALVAIAAIGMAGPAVVAYLTGALEGLAPLLGQAIKFLTVPALLTMGAAYAGPRKPCCEPQATEPKGGNRRHDICAMNVPGLNEFGKFAATVNGKQFDAINGGYSRLWEVKTENVDNHSSWYTGFVVPQTAADVNTEADIAAACEYGFSLLVTDSRFASALIAAGMSGTIEVIEEPNCGLQ